MNPIIERVAELRSEGLRINAIGADRAGSGAWKVWIDLSNLLPLGEGGDLPEHVARVDLQNLPTGVTAGGWERHPRETLIVNASEEGIEFLMREVAREGKAADCARFDGDALDYPHFLTKPNAWR